jgi:hypothetical protein
VTDAAWSIPEARGLTAILFVDTAGHFLTMVTAVML